MAYEMLLSPMNIGSMTVKNRTVMTAAEMSLGQTNGCPTEKMMAYYEERAKGGIGLIIPGICRVNDMGAASTFTQLAMSHDYHIAPMREFAERIHRHGAKLCIQLHHPGRQGYASSINSLPVVIPVVERFPKVLDGLFKCTPLLLGLEEKGICMSVQSPSKCELSAHGATRIHAMSRREIHKLIRDFVDAAERCQKAGVDAVELHGGHGYMIQQFLSPNTNLRTDEYGGSFENRLRFVTEIIEGIRARCGRDYPLIVRLTVDEMYDRIGKPGKGYNLEEGKRIAKRLEELGVDAINVTSACYDVYNRWLEPTSYEPGWRAYLAKEIKSVVSIPVIAANFMRSPDQAERGFAVTVLEKEAVPGGQVNTAAACNLKGKLSWCVEDRLAVLRRLGVELRYKTEATVDSVKALNPYAVLVATGATPLRPRSIRGVDLPQVVTAPEIIHRKTIVENRNVVVAGSGMTGLETAEILNETGNRVTILEMADEIAPGTWFQLLDDELERLTPCGTRFLTSHQLLEIREGEIIAADLKAGKIVHIPADTVVLSLGVRPEHRLADALQSVLPRVYPVGDAVQSGTIADAVKSAWEACSQIR